MTNRSNLFGLVGATLGVIALVLPFTGGLFDGVSPLQTFAYHDDVWAQMLAASAFLSIPIAAWQLRRLSPSPPRPFEVAFAYILSTGAMLPALVQSISGARHLWLDHEIVIACFALLSAWGLATCNAALLALNIRRGVPRDVTAEVFLIGGYLPNTAFALVLFFPFDHRNVYIIVFAGWSIGAYVALAACIAFVARVALLLKSTKPVPPQQGAPTDAPKYSRR